MDPGILQVPDKDLSRFRLQVMKFSFSTPTMYRKKQRPGPGPDLTFLQLNANTFSQKFNNLRVQTVFRLFYFIILFIKLY